MENDINQNDSVASTTDTNDENKTKPRSCCKKCCINIKKFKFHSVIVFLILLSLLGLTFQMIQSSYIPAISVDLQKHFNLSTSKIGFILSSYDIMGIFATPFLSYIGSKYNKCRILAVSGFIYALGLVIFTLPYFIGDKYTIDNFDNTNSNKNMTLDNIDYCILTPEVSSYELNSTIELIDTTTKISLSSKECSRDLSNNMPFAIFIISQLLMSFGASPLFPLGITFLCDNLDEKLHALYTSNILFFY